MKNRDWLLKTAAVDMLCEMNSGLRDAWDAFCACVINGFASVEEVRKRCEKYDFGDRCRDCIAAWMNEERQ